VKVEVRKNKRYEDKLGSGGEDKGKKKKAKDMIFYKDTRMN
jgi:hypothetical protein